MLGIASVGSRGHIHPYKPYVKGICPCIAKEAKYSNTKPETHMDNCDANQTNHNENQTVWSLMKYTTGDNLS
jgi:hypothetical protein